MKYFIRHTAILLLLAVISCQKEGTGRVAMSFGIDDDIYTWTKADALNSATGHTSMKVYTSRKAGESTSPLMAGYVVNYDSSSGGWRYDNVDGQSTQYWDMNADAFRFHAGAPASAVSNITADGLQLGLTSTNVLSETVLFSSPKEVISGTDGFGKTVPLTLNQGNSRVSVAFINNSSSAKTITDLILTPVATYSSSANLVVNYDWSASPATASMSVSSESQSSNPLQFTSVTDIQSGNTNPVFSNTRWYMAPESTADESSTSQWTISFKDGDISRSATFSQTKKWRPGYSYKYVFTIGEDTIDLELITIADWNKVDMNVNTEQVSYKIEVKTTDWGQDNKYVHSFEFVNLYSEDSKNVLWATCGLNSLLYYDNSLKYSWAEVTPSAPGDEDYLNSFFQDNTGFKWQTPTRDDFRALLSGDNTDIEMVKDPETKVFGLVVKSKTQATRSIFLPYTESEKIESVFEETKTRVTRTYMGSYWTRDSYDEDSAYKMKYAFTQIETRTPNGDGGYISDYSSFEKSGESLYVFEIVPKTTPLAVRPLVKITK